MPDYKHQIIDSWRGGKEGIPEVVFTSEESGSAGHNECFEWVHRNKPYSFHEATKNQGLRVMFVPEIKDIYVLGELLALPTLYSGHWDNLKVVTADTRVWLSRAGIKDGAKFNNGVTVDKLIDGVWKTVKKYEALMDVEQYAKDIVDSWDEEALYDFAVDQREI